MSQNTTNDATLGIYVMSYKRPHKILSQKHFEHCTYVVREEEAEAYKEAGVKNILSIPSGAAFDFMSTLYWIKDNTPEDIVFIADDDIKFFIYRTEDYEVITDNETIESEVERIAQIMYDLNIGYACDSPNGAMYAYNKPFAVKGMSGHLRWINKTAFKAKYDPEDPASSDVDIVYQELLMNRIILNPKYLVVSAFMDVNEGIEESRQEHIDYVYALKQKWGKYYDYDFKRNIAAINVKR